MTAGNSCRDVAQDRPAEYPSAKAAVGPYRTVDLDICCIAAFSKAAVRGLTPQNTRGQSPALAYVIRRSRKARNPALDGLIAEVEAEVARRGGLSLAA